MLGAFQAGTLAAQGRAPVQQGRGPDIRDVLQAQFALSQQRQAMENRAFQQQAREQATVQAAQDQKIRDEAIANAPENLRALLRTPQGWTEYVKQQFKETKAPEYEVFGNKDTGFFRFNPATGQQEQIVGAVQGDSNPGLTASMRMRALKIQDTMRLQGVNEADATAIVDGQVKTVTDPIKGGSVLVNVATNKTIPIALDETPLPPVEDLGTSEDLLSIDELAQGTGAAATAKDIAAKTLGQVFPELVDKDTTDARTGLQQLRNRLVAALSISGRPPVIEQERIVELLPDVGFFESPQRAKLVLQSLKRELVRQYQTDATAVRTGLPVQEEREVRQRMSEVRNIINKLDGDKAKPEAEAKPDNAPKRIRFDAQGNIIE